MSVLSTFKFAALLGGLTVLGACGAGGEGAGEQPEQANPVEPSEAQEQGDDIASESGLALVAAGPQSAELGLERWEFSGDSIRGLGPAGEVLAEFVMHADESLIESLVPSAGVLALSETDDTDTFTPEVRQYFEAMQVDREQLSRDAVGNASVQPSVLIICSPSFQACNEAAAAQLAISLVFTSCSCTSTQVFPCGLPGVPGIRLDCF